MELKMFQEINSKLNYKKFFVFYGMNMIKSFLSENEIPLERKIENINLNLTLSMPEKILISLEKIIKFLKSLKNFFDKNIGEEEHWIYASLEEMIENDENYDQNEIKILKSTTTLKVHNNLIFAPMAIKIHFLQILKDDKMKKMNLFDLFKELMVQLQNLLGENLKIGEDLKNEMKDVFECLTINEKN